MKPTSHDTTLVCVFPPTAAFEQQGKLNYTDSRLIATTEDRACTKARDLMCKYNLGNPIAANFFLAEYDDFVPKLYKMLDENLQKQKSSQQ